MCKAFIPKITTKGIRLVATVSALALTGSAMAQSEAMWEYRRAIIMQQQLPAECYDGSGNLVITPENVELCSALPTTAIGFGPPDTENGNDRGDDDDDSFGDDDTTGDDDDTTGDDDDEGDDDDGEGDDDDDGEGDDDGGEGDGGEGDDDSDDDTSDDDSEGGSRESRSAS